jgi:hypothetical protein
MKNRPIIVLGGFEKNQGTLLFHQAAFFIADNDFRAGASINTYRLAFMSVFAFD